MTEIERQRIAAVRALEALGHCFRDGRWHAPLHASLQRKGWAEADALHQLLVQRADTLIGCTDGSADQDEPDGKVDGARDKGLLGLSAARPV